MGVNRPVHPADVNAAGVGARPDAAVDFIRTNAAGVGLAVDRTLDPADFDPAGIGARAQLAVRGRLNFQAHRDVAEHVWIAHRHTDAVPVLCDGRVRFQLPETAFGVALAKTEAVRFQDPAHPNRTGRSGNHGDPSRIGVQVEFDGAVDRECPVERTFWVLSERNRGGNRE